MCATIESCFKRFQTEAYYLLAHEIPHVPNPDWLVCARGLKFVYTLHSILSKVCGICGIFGMFKWWSFDHLIDDTIILMNLEKDGGI